MMRAGRFALACLVFSFTPTPLASALTINEVFYDAEGADDGKVFIELFGAAGLSLDGFTLEGVNGSGGGIGPVLTLTGVIPDDGLFVVADRAGAVSEVAEADLLLNFDLQNGPDSLVLRAADASLVDALGYGVFGSGEVFAGEGQPAPDAPAGQSLARRFLGLDTDDNAADFLILATPTPGSGLLAVPESPGGLLVAVALVGLLLARARTPRGP